MKGILSYARRAATLPAHFLAVLFVLQPINDLPCQFQDKRGFSTGEHGMSTILLLGAQDINLFSKHGEKSKVHSTCVNQTLQWSARVAGPFLPFFVIERNYLKRDPTCNPRSGNLHSKIWTGGGIQKEKGQSCDFGQLWFSNQFFIKDDWPLPLVFSEHLLEQIILD